MIAEVMTPGREGAPKTRGAALEMRGDAPKPRGADLETRGGTLGPWIGGGRGAGTSLEAESTPRHHADSDSSARCPQDQK